MAASDLEETNIYLIFLCLAGLQDRKVVQFLHGTAAVGNAVSGFQTHGVITNAHHLPLGKIFQVLSVIENLQTLSDIRVGKRSTCPVGKSVVITLLLKTGLWGENLIPGIQILCSMLRAGDNGLGGDIQNGILGEQRVTKLFTCSRWNKSTTWE